MELFGAVAGDDPLYEAVSEGASYPGAEHWLPLFYENLETLFDYVPEAIISFDHLAADARAQRLEQIEDHYEARKMALEQASFGTPPYKPVPPKLMFLGTDEWDETLTGPQGAAVLALRRHRECQRHRQPEFRRQDRTELCARAGGPVGHAVRGGERPYRQAAGGGQAGDRRRVDRRGTRTARRTCSARTA